MEEYIPDPLVSVALWKVTRSIGKGQLMRLNKHGHAIHIAKKKIEENRNM